MKGQKIWRGQEIIIILMEKFIYFISLCLFKKKNKGKEGKTMVLGKIMYYVE